MDKTIVVTGASSGFGKAMAERFGQAGANVIPVSRNAGELQEVARRVSDNGGNAVPVVGDVTRTSTFERILATALEHFGRIDVLVNNAGGGIRVAPLEGMDDDTIQSCLDLNLSSVVRGCRPIVPQMKMQKSGLIINITSACAKYAWPEWSVYSAAKAGLSMFSRCLYAELRPFGIGVSVIAPGASNTGFLRNAGIADAIEWNEGNALRPEHIAEAAFGIVSQSGGAVIPEVIVFGMEQEIIPF